MSYRITRDYMKLKMLELLAMRSTCLRRQVGCLIVRDDRIISTGYNGLPSGMPNCCNTGECLKEEFKSEEYKVCIHSEQNALMQCAKLGIPTDGADLYVNADVCMTCAKLILAAGIKKVVVIRDFAGKVGDAGIELLRGNGVIVEIWDPTQVEALR